MELRKVGAKAHPELHQEDTLNRGEGGTQRERGKPHKGSGGGTAHSHCHHQQRLTNSNSNDMSINPLNYLPLLTHQHNSTRRIHNRGMIIIDKSGQQEETGNSQEGYSNEHLRASGDLLLKVSEPGRGQWQIFPTIPALSRYLDKG